MQTMPSFKHIILASQRSDALNEQKKERFWPRGSNLTFTKAATRTIKVKYRLILGFSSSTLSPLPKVQKDRETF